jgi:DNA primase
MQELRDRLSLSEVIGRRVKLTRAGREYKACCPFHSEKSPSFYVNDDKQFFHCFGCGAHGDVIGFAMRNDNLSFIEAVESLAALAGMQVPQQTPQDIARAKLEKDLYSLLDDTSKWFESRLRDPAHADALTYMKERGVSEEMLTSFRIGFSPQDGQALPRFLKGQGYSEAQMVEAGVARLSNRDGQAFSFFRDRVMFPVPDRRGRVVAFGGRVLPEHLRPLNPGDSKPPKYINSSETAIFHKGRMLYGEPHARQAAVDGLPLIVVEGYLDVMAAFSAGYRGALAPLGTALTEEQIMVLWKMIPADQKVPVLCFDGDNAGRRAAARACERILPLLKADHSIRLAFLPDGQDPDSLIRSQGKKAFDAIIESAMPLVDFIWMNHTAGKKFATPEERAGLGQALDNEALKIADRDVQHYYKDAFRQKVRAAFGPAPFKKQPWQGRGKPPAAKLTGLQMRRPAFSNTQTRVQILLACILNHPGLFGWVEDELGRLDIADDRLSALRQGIIQVLGEGLDLDSGALQSHLKDAGYGIELESVLSETVYTHAGFARSDSELDIVQKGWQHILSQIQGDSVSGEISARWKAWVDQPDDEIEKRLVAFQLSNRASQNKDD